MRTLALLLALTGCKDRPAPVDSAPDDSGLGGPVLDVDVLIIGAGPAGLAASYEAQAAGASVLILEMAEEAGGGGWYAGHFFGAGTRLQQTLGIADTPEQALSEWAEFTHGGDPDDPWVRMMVLSSAEVIDWMVEEHGVMVDGVFMDASIGSVPRAHVLSANGSAPVSALIPPSEDLIWLEHRADALITEDGAVIGAQFTDLRTGEAGWVQAGATIVATGGFARSSEWVLRDRPELEGLEVVFEHYEGAVAGGHGMLSDAGAQFTDPGGLGVYVHSIPDPRSGFDGESILPIDLMRAMVVNLDGERVTNEDNIRSTFMFDVLLEAPERRLLAIVPASFFGNMEFGVPGYNWVVSGREERMSSQEVLDAGAALAFDAPAEMAAHFGMPADTLEASLARYDDLCAQRQDEDFGKPPEFLVPFGADPLYVLELVPGLAKAFGGVTLDEDARVLGVDGAPIPGLFAAGEVAGMLGTEAVGIGFTGSMTAVILTGRVAGTRAAGG